uniref:hypothetical protein n=1 Tax=Fulvivirga sp. TaxID=1931237 RepID=UPI0040491864
MSTIYIKVGAQDYSPGLYMQTGGGLSIPLGDFSSKQMSNWVEHCGCANSNGAVGVNAYFRLKGIFFGVFGFQKAWNSYAPKPIAIALNKDFGAQYSVESDSWKSSIYKFGATYKISFPSESDSFWSLMFESSLIVNELETYYLKIRSSDGSERYPLRQQSVDDTGYGYSAGLILLKEWDGIGVSLTTTYTSSKHNVKGADRRFNGGDLEPQEYSQSVKLLIVQLGVFIAAY